MPLIRLSPLSLRRSYSCNSAGVGVHRNHLSWDWPVKNCTLCLPSSASKEEVHYAVHHLRHTSQRVRLQPHPGLKNGKNQRCGDQGCHCCTCHGKPASGCLSHVEHHDHMDKALQSARCQRSAQFIEDLLRSAAVPAPSDSATSCALDKVYGLPEHQRPGQPEALPQAGLSRFLHVTLRHMEHSTVRLLAVLRQ